MDQEFASSLLENAVSEFAKLPGIGRKTALRLVLYLLRQNENASISFGEAIIRLRKEIKYCSRLSFRRLAWTTDIWRGRIQKVEYRK